MYRKGKMVRKWGKLHREILTRKKLIKFKKKKIGRKAYKKA